LVFRLVAFRPEKKKGVSLPPLPGGKGKRPLRADKEGASSVPKKREGKKSGIVVVKFTQGGSCGCGGKMRGSKKKNRTRLS